MSIEPKRSGFRRLQFGRSEILPRRGLRNEKRGAIQSSIETGNGNCRKGGKKGSSHIEVNRYEEVLTVSRDPGGKKFRKKKELIPSLGGPRFPEKKNRPVTPKGAQHGGDMRIMLRGGDMRGTQEGEH